MYRPSKQTGQAPPVWLWFTALFSVAAFAGLVMFLDYHQKRDIHAADPGATIAKGGDKSANHNKRSGSGKKLPGDGNKFDFYQLLPDLESIVSDKDIAKEKAQKSQPRSTNDKKPTAVISHAEPALASQEYYLQVGAYSQFPMADRMKANLALLGLKAEIQRVEIGKLGRVHRVRLGPYASIRDMRHDQQKLKAANIQSIMVRSKVAKR